jgi:hypothetical protein
VKSTLRQSRSKDAEIPTLDPTRAIDRVGIPGAVFLSSASANAGVRASEGGEDAEASATGSRRRYVTSTTTSSFAISPTRSLRKTSPAPSRIPFARSADAKNVACAYEASQPSTIARSPAAWRKSV